MNIIYGNLERSYQLFINSDRPLSFFKGLADYLEYVLGVPELGQVFDQQMDQRRVLYKRIEESEKKTMKELALAERKLVSLINKMGVDVASFERYQTAPFHEKTTILEELESYKKRQSIGSVFTSNEIERHLFDIAANLLKKGYKKELSEFLVSPQEYAEHYRRLNGRSEYAYTGNPYGNFIFSKTRLQRFEQERHFEHERVMRPWGSFERLLRFIHAFRLQSNASVDAILSARNGTESEPWFGSTREILDIAGMVSELSRLSESELDFYSMVDTRFERVPVGELRNLRQNSLKEAAQAAHIILMRSLVENNSMQPQKNTLRSIHLITNSVAANDAIFLVLDEHFEMPIRFMARNVKGKDSSAKQLHNIAYVIDAPGKGVKYDKRTADNINNGLFRKEKVANYMKTNKLEKPTLVQKSPNGMLVLKNEVPVKNDVISTVPAQHKPLYIDKTQ